MAAGADVRMQGWLMFCSCWLGSLAADLQEKTTAMDRCVPRLADVEPLIETRDLRGLVALGMSSSTMMREWSLHACLVVQMLMDLQGDMRDVLAVAKGIKPDLLRRLPIVVALGEVGQERDF